MKHTITALIFAFVFSGCASADAFLSQFKPDATPTPIPTPSPTPEPLSLDQMTPEQRDEYYLEWATENLCEVDMNIRRLKETIAEEKTAARQTGYIHAGVVQNATIGLNKLQAEKKRYLNEYKEMTGKTLKSYKCTGYTTN